MLLDALSCSEPWLSDACSGGEEPCGGMGGLPQVLCPSPTRVFLQSAPQNQLSVSQSRCCGQAGISVSCPGQPQTWAPCCDVG